MDLKGVFNSISDTVSKKVKENDLYKSELDKSNVFILDNDLVIDENSLIEGNWYEYNSMCVYIDIDYAKKIDGIIPINEVVLFIAQVISKKDNLKYFMVLTSNRIIILDKEKYNYYNYHDINKIELIANKMMCKIIKFNDIVLELDTSQKDWEIFYSIITNNDYRNKYINYKKQYLCGIEPVCQFINKIGSGISIDNDNNIVFHDRKERNYLCKYNDILNYELLEDNNVVLKRKSKDGNSTLGLVKKDCYRMCIRVTLTNNQLFEIVILEPTTFNSSYPHTDNNYIYNYDFVKKIFDKLDDMNPELKKC